MNSSYSDFSCVYDKFIDDVDYKSLCESLLLICKEFSHTPRLVLDACCGTGNFTKELIEKGFDVIGVDNSSQMLSIAKDKLGESCSLICQDLCELDLYGTVDTVFCMLDSLNHITDYEDFKLAVSRLALFLEPGGLMVFDVNTIFKHKEILSDNIFTQEKENIYMIWENSLYEDNIVNINLDFFVGEEDGRYSRLCENFDERAYSDDELNSALKDAGLTVLKTIDFYSGDEPNETSEKIVYIVKKGE